MPSDGAPKTLLLIGGGHAHVQLLLSPSFAPPLTRILLSDTPTAVYSGVLPAVISGHASADEAHVSLPALCARTGWTFICGRATGISTRTNTVTYLPHHSTTPAHLHYSALSIDVGSTAARLPGRGARTLYTRPIGGVLPGLRTFDVAGGRGRVAVVGGGVAAVELAFTLEARLRGRARVEVVSGAPDFGALGAAGRHVRAELRERGVAVRLGRRVKRVCEGGVELEGGGVVQADLVVVATGAAAHAWLRDATDLQVDGAGCVLVGDTLQAAGRADVFAAGDCAGFGGAYGEEFPPKAGVYAVRMGPVLEANVARVLCGGGALERFVPQRTALQIVALGDGRAIGAKGRLVVRGAWVYGLKCYLDRRWQARFQGEGDGDWERGDEFVGGAAEGAAALVGPEPQCDAFAVQYAVLRRMDRDAAFAEGVLRCMDRE